MQVSGGPHNQFSIPQRHSVDLFSLEDDFITQLIFTLDPINIAVHTDGVLLSRPRDHSGFIFTFSPSFW